MFRQSSLLSALPSSQASHPVERSRIAARGERAIGSASIGVIIVAVVAGLDAPCSPCGVDLPEDAAKQLFRHLRHLEASAPSIAGFKANRFSFDQIAEPGGPTSPQRAAVLAAAIWCRRRCHRLVAVVARFALVHHGVVGNDLA